MTASTISSLILSRLTGFTSDRPLAKSTSSVSIDAWTPGDGSGVESRFVERAAAFGLEADATEDEGESSYDRLSFLLARGNDSGEGLCLDAMPVLFCVLLLLLLLLFVDER
jgi:hypothetical protein